MDGVAIPLRETAVRGPTVSTYREYRPHPSVAGVVACTWDGVAGWGRTLRVLPDGRVDLVWDGTALVATGVAVGTVRHPLGAGGNSVGLRLRIGAAGALGVPADELDGSGTPLGRILGSGGVARWEGALAAARSTGAQRAILTGFVADRLRAGYRPDPLVTAAVRSLAGDSVAGTARRVGTTGQELRRRFYGAVGCGPKELQRVLRFQRFRSRLPALAAGPIGLAAVAADCGYADQAHLTRECRALSGSTPGALVRRWSAPA